MSDWKENFIQHLKDLREKEDRAALAAMRRGLNSRDPESNFDASGHVLPWLPDGLPRKEVRNSFMTAALFAWHPLGGGDGSLGLAMSKIEDLSGSGERRFTALLDADYEDLPVYLMQIVGLLRSKDIPIDWLQFLKDVSWWNHPDRFVQKRWARDYWRPKGE